MLFGSVVRSRDGAVPPQLQASSVVGLAKNLDALLELLDATADRLAATWDMQRDGIRTGELRFGYAVGKTIH